MKMIIDCSKGAAFLVLALELCFLQQARPLGDDRLFLLSLLPYPDDRNPPALDTGPSLFLAAELAVEHINSRSDILGDYRLELIRGDSGCQLSAKTVTAFAEHVLNDINEQIVGIIGPACSSSGEIIARLTGTDLLGLINVHVAGSALLSDRVKYPFSFGMLASNEVFADTLTALLVKNSWNRVATLYDESWLTAVEVSFMRMVSNLSGFAVNVASVISDNNLSLRDIDKASIRIVIVLLRAEFLRKVLCLAYHEDVLYPRYQFVIVGTVEEINDIQFQYNGMNYVCSRENMVATLNGSIIIDYQLFPLNTTVRTDTGLSYNAFVDLYTTLINEQNENDIENSLSPIFLASSYYDAVWSLALSLNNSIKPLDKMNITLSQYRLGLSSATCIIQQQILELDFAGVSGRVHFDRRTGYVASRIVDIYQYRNGTADLVAYYNNSNIIQISPVDFINSSFNVNLIPARAPLPVAVIFLTLIGVALFLVTTSHILSLVYRKKRAIRATQPKLNQLGYAGCYTFVIALLSYILAETFSFDSRTHCILYHMLNTAVTIGSSLLAGILCVKTWRIYKIFVKWRNPGKLISDSVLITFVLIIVVGDIVVCTLWIILDPFRLEEVDRNRMGAEENATIEVREICRSAYYNIWFASLTAYHGLQLFVSLYLAYVCHHRIPRVQREFRTNSIIILVCAVSVTVSLGFAVYFILPESVDFTLEFITFCTTLTLIEYYCLFLVFLPPIFQLWNQLRKQRYLLTTDEFL